MSKIRILSIIPVAMFVGEEDSGWREAIQATEAELAHLGGTVSLEVVEGEPHVIRSLGGEELFDILDSYRAA